MIIEHEADLNRAITEAAAINDGMNRGKMIVGAVKTLPKTTEAISLFPMALSALNKITNPDDRRLSLESFLKELPLDDDFFKIYSETTSALLSSAEEMSDPRASKTAMQRIVSEIPDGPTYNALYKEAITRSINVSNRIENPSIRRPSLIGIAEELPRDDEFLELRLYAMALALGLSKEPQNVENDLALITHELPKTCDYEFYRNNTFFGAIQRMPKKGPFKALYIEAIETALHASELIDEPFFRKYALIFIAEELPKTDEFTELYKKIITMTIEESLAIKEPFARHYALHETMKTIPKKPEFVPLLLKIIENMLPFYSVKSRMEDLSAIDVIDYLIVAEERKMNDNKKSRYMREHYAKLFAIELNKFAKKLNDVRFVKLLKPYTHVWIQPKILRDTASEIVEFIEGVKDRFHGKEVLMPEFVSEVHIQDKFANLTKANVAAEKAANETISIDLGATNTVIMKKKADSSPEFVFLDNISIKRGGISTIPTLLDPSTQMIGTEARGAGCVTDLKKRLLQGKKDGKKNMENFFDILYEDIKKEFTPTGWLKKLYGGMTESLYLSVPIGYTGYSKSMKRILDKTARTIRTEIVEEPLAAAIGYQVAEDKDKIVMIIDFGGCTLDIMVVRVNIDEVHVVAKPDRSTMLGGMDIDLWLATYLAEKAAITTDPLPRELIEKAEEIKIALSDHGSVTFEWKGKRVCNVTTKDYEEILDSHDFYKTIDRTVSYVLKKTEKIGVAAKKIEDVLLCGGSSQIPSFKEKIGDLFPALREDNKIYDHSPLTAVAEGAALYGTRQVTDRHLANAYAIRYKGDDVEKPQSYELIFEKGEPLPFEKTFSFQPAGALGPQREIFIELFEIPESQITRRWEKQQGLEYIKQIIKQPLDSALNALKVISLRYDQEIAGTTEATFLIAEDGTVTIRYGKTEKIINSNIRLQ